MTKPLTSAKTSDKEMPWDEHLHIDVGDMEGPGRGLVFGLGIALVTIVLCVLGVWALVALGGG